MFYVLRTPVCRLRFRAGSEEELFPKSLRTKSAARESGKGLNDPDGCDTMEKNDRRMNDVRNMHF